MNQLQQFLMQMSGGVGPGMPLNDDFKEPDSSEQITISSLALLKMLKHARAGVPMEVMGLMLGSFVDDYTIRVVDVFAMPQSGTGVSVEAVDPVFQTRMMDLLKMTGRGEQVVGWYHSHPGFGCWLSNVDVNTQKSFEQLHERAVAVVVDPIQSVKGKVVIDTFRTIDPTRIVYGEPRQTTSMLGHLQPQSLVALMHGLNRHYYSLGINYRKTSLEEKMLLNLHKSEWKEGLKMKNFLQHAIDTQENVKMMKQLSKTYNNSLIEEEKLTEKQLALRNVGKLDAKRRLEELAEECIEENVVCLLGESMSLVGTKGIRKIIDSTPFDESVLEAKKSALLRPPKAVRIRSAAKTAKSFWPKEKSPVGYRKQKRPSTPLFNPESSFFKKSKDYLEKNLQNKQGFTEQKSLTAEKSVTKNLPKAGILNKFGAGKKSLTLKQSQNQVIQKFLAFRKSNSKEFKSRSDSSYSGGRRSKTLVEKKTNERIKVTKSEIQKTALSEILNQLKTIHKSKSGSKTKNKPKQNSSHSTDSKDQ